MTKLTFTVPAGKVVVLRVTDYLLSSDVPSIWDATGEAVSRI
jgi:hypothetical protein